MNFWKDGIGIDESRVSILILSFFVSIIFSLIMYYLHQDISDNLLSLLIAQITAVGGINIAEKISSMVKNKNDN